MPLVVKDRDRVSLRTASLRKDREAASQVERAADDAYLSPSVQRAAKLLRHIAEGDAVTNMARTARELGINRTTLLRLLHTLEAEHFIQTLGPNQPGWRIGLGLIGLAAQAFFSEDLVQVCVPVLTSLTEHLGLSAHLGVLDGLDVVYMVRRTPNHAFASNVRVGSRLPAHASSMGRIILANMPAALVDRMYADQPLKAVTDETAVTLAALHVKIGEDRAAGVAWSDGQFERGISSVAAAVFDASGAPVAAINVSGQTVRFDGKAHRKTIEDATLKAAEDISLRLGWHATPRASPVRRP